MYDDNNIILVLRNRVHDGDFIYTVWFIVGVNKLILLFNFHAWQAKSFSCSDQIVWLLPPVFLTNLKTSGSSLSSSLINWISKRFKVVFGSLFIFMFKKLMVVFVNVYDLISESCL